jgi:hypothetical protein
MRSAASSFFNAEAIVRSAESSFVSAEMIVCSAGKCKKGYKPI